MSEYIIGLGDYAQKLKAAAKNIPPGGYLDLNQYELSGVTTVDRYTYRIKVKGKYPQFHYWLAMPFFSPVPAEVDRFYSQPGMADKNLTLDWYPVGAGPYMMTVNNPNRQMVLQRNPNFPGEPYPSEGDPGDEAAGLLKDAGKRMPFIDKVVFSLENSVLIGAQNQRRTNLAAGRSRSAGDSDVFRGSTTGRARRRVQCDSAERAVVFDGAGQPLGTSGRDLVVPPGRPLVALRCFSRLPASADEAGLLEAREDWIDGPRGELGCVHDVEPIADAVGDAHEDAHGGEGERSRVGHVVVGLCSGATYVAPLHNRTAGSHKGFGENPSRQPHWAAPSGDFHRLLRTVHGNERRTG
jgi:hypothetical protein